MNGILIVPALAFLTPEQVDLVLANNTPASLDLVCNGLYRVFTSSRPMMLSSLVAVSFLHTDKVYLLKNRHYRKGFVYKGLCEASMFKDIMELHTAPLGETL